MQIKRASNDWFGANKLDGASDGVVLPLVGGTGFHKTRHFGQLTNL